MSIIITLNHKNVRIIAKVITSTVEKIITMSVLLKLLNMNKKIHKVKPSIII
jgi:hypothetical protein